MQQPKLSTMVVLYNLNLKINTSLILENLPLDDNIVKIEKKGVLVRGTSSRDKIKRRSSRKSKESNTGFGRNSITIVTLNNGDGSLPLKEITTKIFQNGVFHMTGVLDPLYDEHTLKYILNKIFSYCSESIMDFNNTYEILKRRVVLMNYTTEILPKNTIPRETLYKNIKNLHDPNILASYDPDIYPGVKIQFIDSNWTAKVFRTGKMILTGVTSKDDCLKFISILGDLFKISLPLK